VKIIKNVPGTCRRSIPWHDHPRDWWYALFPPMTSTSPTVLPCRSRRCYPYRTCRRWYATCPQFCHVRIARPYPRIPRIWIALRWWSSDKIRKLYSDKMIKAQLRWSERQLYLERNPAVTIFVNDVEHFLHEDCVGPHTESTCKLALGKRCAHYRDDLSGITVFRPPPSLAGP